MPLKIAVDAMGGDFAPTEAVKGALIVARERPDLEIVLVGSEAAISETLERARRCSRFGHGPPGGAGD